MEWGKSLYKNHHKDINLTTVQPIYGKATCATISRPYNVVRTTTDRKRCSNHYYHRQAPSSRRPALKACYSTSFSTSRIPTKQPSRRVLYACMRELLGQESRCFAEVKARVMKKREIESKERKAQQTLYKSMITSS